MDLKKFIKHLFGIPMGVNFSTENIIHYNRVRLGKYLYHKKYTALDVIEVMKQIGLKKGGVVMIHCSWDEFYNCVDSPETLINCIIDVIGPDGTLCMPSIPFLRGKKPFNVKRTVTSAGILAETFRTFPNVKRSIHVQHAVCALGPQSDYLLSEHHIGETCWDTHSPFYRLSEVNATVFAIGLGKYWPGTEIHCVESILRKDIDYYSDLFETTKTEFFYVDYDGETKSYYNYDLKKTKGCRREISYRKCKRIVKKNLEPQYAQISNLQLASFDASKVVGTLLSLAKRGIDVYGKPSKKGYMFNQ